jgi:predicted secreted protein
MQALIDSEGTTALRKARLVASFNKGYRTFRRTYQTCTTSAEEAAAKFLTEGAEIAGKLIARKDAKPGAPQEDANEPAPEASAVEGAEETQN